MQFLRTWSFEKLHASAQFRGFGDHAGYTHATAHISPSLDGSWVGASGSPASLLAGVFSGLQPADKARNEEWALGPGFVLILEKRPRAKAQFFLERRPWAEAHGSHRFELRSNISPIAVAMDGAPLALFARFSD